MEPICWNPIASLVMNRQKIDVQIFVLQKRNNAAIKDERISVTYIVENWIL